MYRRRARTVASGDTGTAAPAATDAATRARTLAFRIVLVGLVLLVAGFTATLVSNAFYPCEPSAGSSVQPPLGDCAVALSPWIGIAIVGLIVAVVGYFRVG